MTGVVELPAATLEKIAVSFAPGTPALQFWLEFHLLLKSPSHVLLIAASRDAKANRPAIARAGERNIFTGELVASDCQTTPYTSPMLLLLAIKSGQWDFARLAAIKTRQG
jgi:hypothetical protein